MCSIFLTLLSKLIYKNIQLKSERQTWAEQFQMFSQFNIYYIDIRVSSMKLKKINFISRFVWQLNAL